MMRSRIALVTALVVAAIVVAVTVAVALGRSDEPGTDAHASFDPITTADEVAVAVMAGVHTWTPAQQQSPWDALHAVSDRLTGQMADAAATRPDPDPTPRQWAAWARSGDRVIGATAPAGDQAEVPLGATEATRVVEVRQKVLHPDGATTPLEQITVAVELELVGQQWKVASYQYQSVGTK
ncbi:hypothetical protein M3E00_02635 [Dietzia cinnamea]|uniref:hypothetical protein n=1 Tax=Dietzia cinnamea TaxID=321318 RepID=UPI0021A8C057|nr:hypothetical protein [Dietzia cinnamea]MCT2097492.1 hypothetical protein [Dietzia cinnamea]